MRPFDLSPSLSYVDQHESMPPGDERVKLLVDFIAVMRDARFDRTEPTELVLMDGQGIAASAFGIVPSWNMKKRMEDASGGLSAGSSHVDWWL